MKLRTFLTSLLLLTAGAASATITTGYYRVKSYNDKYLTENISDNTLLCSDLADGNYSQVWYINVSGSDVTFKNTLTDKYIQGQGTYSSQYYTGTTQQAFTLGESDSKYTFQYDSWFGGGLHCSNGNFVVEWYVSDDKSKWTVEAVDVDADALNAQKNALSEATTTQLTTFFTTTACTELNSAYVTMSDANLRNAMSALPTTVQDLAVKVKNNAWATYGNWSKTELDFRVANYKAYSSHSRWTSILGLGWSFGRLTNPTGISVSAGDYIQVYVGAIPSGQTVKLEVAGDYQAEGTTYTLQQGMNALLMASSGNCFVCYEVDNTSDGNTPYTKLSNYADVTVHIEGGTVNGYFDLTKGNTNADWTNLQNHLLQGSSVELKTNNLVFHMTTDLVKEACPTNMVELLGEWDKILDMEHSLMGIEDFDGYWNNMLSATDMTSDYMYAKDYGTYYNTETLSSVMSYETLFAGGALWGPAHENGHVFQKYINMVGQTEVSNNLFSNVAVYNNGHLTSRATNISTTFQNMANNVYWNDRDIWERTHLYFQLYQFFHILGNKSDFYPELFKALRSDPMVHTAGTFISATDDYLKFYKKCCEVSGYDLTEFFQAYGFFVVPTLTTCTLNNVTKDAYHIGDYGDYYLTVTQAEIDAAKAEVAAMSGLQKCNIIFIEDRITAPDATYDGATAGAKKAAYSDEFPIGQAGQTGQYTTFDAACSAYTYNVTARGHVTVSGTGAVGFKLYDSAGNLCGVYNTYTFSLPAEAFDANGLKSGYSLKAAAGNGSDIAATFDANIEVNEFPRTDKWYVIKSKGQTNRYIQSTGSGQGLIGNNSTPDNTMHWRFQLRTGEAETFDIINRDDDSYINPVADNNTQLSTSSTQPTSGWKVAVSGDYYYIFSGTTQINQTSYYQSYQIFNWGGGSDTSDNCLFSIEAADDYEEVTPVIPTGSDVNDVTSIADNATDAVTVGSQITAEANITSGKPYILKTGANRYITEASTYYDVNDNTSASGSPSKASTYYLISNSGTWKIRNYYTGKYWGVPVYNTALAPADEASAGAWSLNFSSNIAYPSAPDASSTTRGIDRSGGKVWGWSTGTNNNHKVYIYEVAASSTALSELDNKDIVVSSTAASTVETGQWYVMFDRGANHGYLYENSSSHTLYNTNTVPSGYAPDNAQYLVRIVGEDGNYYLQTGFGNYFGNITASTAVPTTGLKEQLITIKKISGTDGHYYLASSAGVILDANDTKNGDATVVGWGTTVPTSTGGNNDWAFYPVELVDSWTPTISEVYTINNNNTDRGALIYNPDASTSYVWSSGKSGTFDASNANSQWVIIPTGTADQYYLYNVGAGKFAIPSGSASLAAWKLSTNAVAVTLIRQTDGTYKIKTATTDTYVSVSNEKTNPIINYNDIGSNFTITKVENVTALAAATIFFNRLADQQEALTAVPSSGTEGWYIIRIKSHGTYADKYVYPAESEITYNNTNYPLTFDHDVNVRPAIDDVTYYTRISSENNQVYWQLPNGKYLYGSGNKFPISTFSKETFSMDYNSSNGFRMWGSSRYAVPYLLGGKYFIGETSSSGNAYYDIYPINLATAGYVAWKVTITNASDDTQLTCTRSDVNGLTTVYNNGYFFLPSDVTPTSEDFTLTGMLSCTIDTDTKTITAEYDPELSLLASDVAVIQGNQTTGKGNTMQALLRIKATPFADFQPTQFTISLSGAAQVDNVKVYSTTSDQIRFDGVTPTLLGTTDSPSDGTVDIDLTSESVSAGTTMYYWITADVKSTATEWETIDASLSSISYTNTYKADHSLAATTLDLSSIGNPDGEMRIYKQQSELWTASKGGSQYYRIPTIINTTDGGIVALTDDRHASSKDLGNHKIDVVARKSMDGGLTWDNAVTVATGDGSSDASYGYGDPAVVRTLSGKLICLMAAGKNSYSSGQLHMGYSESTDNGATWSVPVDIYSSIEKNGLAITSAFTTAGKGVTFSNGRVAFAMNGKVSGTTNEYIIYSDDEGASWTLSSSAAFTGADESKLEIMNDNSLLVSVRRGGFNSMANRGYNRTTGDASGDGINDWGTQGNWGSEMNANGCNADILYYNRDTEDDSRPDVIFHTLTKTYSTYRKDLRLYMSFDQGATWKEAFQLQPGYAAYSSMQKLANGDLAIIFEDGSIGNEDAQDCYAINYVVISSELINDKIDELFETAFTPTATIISQGETNGSAPWGTWSPTSGWANTFTTNASSGLAGVVVSATSTLLNRETDYGQRVFCIKPSNAGATDEFTITAPDGYIIKSYSIGGHYYTASEKYTLTSADGTMSANVNTNSGTPNILTVDDINAQSTSFKMTSLGSTNTRYACITTFTVQVVSATTYTRSITAGRWGTVCVPGAVTATDISGAEIYRIAGKTVNAQNQPTALMLEQVTEMEAGKPYFFYPTETSLSLTYMGKTAVSMPRSENGLIGSFKGTDVDEGNYLLSNNQIVLCGTGCSIGANRAYINMEEVLEYSGIANVKSISVFFDPATGIQAIDHEQSATDNDGPVYNMAGQLVNSKMSHRKLAKGVYIVNGRKVIIK